MPADQIFIDNLDGAGFEALCADIYERLGYKVHNIQHTGDKGRDLILKSPKGETIVGECKHWSGGSIGRPIVQKLHSAAINEGAQKGLILTTGGTLTRQARDYISELLFPIELIDLPKLKSLAAQAGIALVSDLHDLPILCLPLSNASTLKKRLNQHLLSNFNSYPTSASSLFSMRTKGVEWEPVYQVRYSLKEIFRTSVGVIHHVDEKNGIITLSGISGDPIQKNLSALLKQSLLTDVSEAFNESESMLLKQFNIDVKTIDYAAKERIVDRHSASVGYYGRNNVYYTKKCIPSKRNIHLRDISQIYIPIRGLEIRAIEHRYDLTLSDSSQDVCFINNGDLFLCKVCESSFDARKEGTQTLCNACGAIACDWFCSFHCNNCNKTICKNCTYWTRRWLIFKRKFCHECGSVVDAKKLT